MKKNKYIILGLLMAVFFCAPNVVKAAREQGTDLAVYQGNTAKTGYNTDKFVISQIGGYSGGLYDQTTYGSQVADANAKKLRAHTYIWYEVGSNLTAAKTTMDYFIPKIKTPAGSIVALDYEAGASWDKQANTDAILYGMRRLAQAGYTPMYYSYKPYTLNNVDYARILKEFPNSLWIAAYPDYLVRSQPLYSMFPSMNGISLWQFTSTYVAGGLDGNVDLTDVTMNGYSSKKSEVPHNTLVNVISSKVKSYNAATVYDENLNPYDVTPALDATKWQSNKIKLDKDNRAYFRIGAKQYIPQRSTNLKGIVKINYLYGYGPQAYNKKGEQIKDSNKKFKGGTTWKITNIVKIPKVGYCYQVSDKEYIEVKYQVGSGFKG